MTPIGRFAWEEFGGKPAAQFVMESLERCTDCAAKVSEAEHRYSLAPPLIEVA
jgi:hypothetical protein